MGKIVKYCAACDESFAEKFGFCPNCGQAMSAFEMNPMSGQTAMNEEAKVSDPKITNFAAQTPATNSADQSPVAESVLNSNVIPFFAPETPVFTNENKTEDFAANNLQSSIPVPEAEKVSVKKVAADSGNNYYASNLGSPKTAAVSAAPVANDGFRVTVMEEKNVRQRNLLLLGSMFFMIALCLGGVVYSLFAKDLFIGAIDDGGMLAFIQVDEPPMEVEEKPKPKDNKDAGGGGGGGRKEETPTSKGRLATQTEQPLIAPTKTIVQNDRFELKQVASTQGNIKRVATNEAYGDPNSKFGLSSDGTGSGGGQGSGTGTGQGSGRGTGEGSGIGSGSGSGRGTGTGSGTGAGTQGVAAAPPPPPPVKKPEPVGVTEPIKILAKPKALYTDAARQNQVTGTVRVRVTFSANGQIAGVTPVNGLPYGLTEQAIAAARNIKFEPPKRNGVPYPVTKTFEYNFTLY